MQDVSVYPYIEGAELAERAHCVVLDLSLGSLVCLGTGGRWMDGWSIF